MSLTTEKQFLIEQRVSNEKKSEVLAYIFLCLFGLLGAHRLYLGKIGTGLLMPLITLLTFGFGLIITLPWVIIDLFLVPSMVREHADKLRTRYQMEALGNP